MSPRGVSLILISAVMTAGANLLMRAGVRAAGGFVLTVQSLLALASQTMFVSGILFYGLAAVLWFAVVATEDLSSSYPMLVAAVFILVTTGAAVFFQEHISVQKVAGLMVILSGILLVGRS
jgi:multidrug transporter EmrE-like cation transporter